MIQKWRKIDVGVYRSAREKLTSENDDHCDADPVGSVPPSIAP